MDRDVALAAVGKVPPQAVLAQAYRADLVAAAKRFTQCITAGDATSAVTAAKAASDEVAAAMKIIESTKAGRFTTPPATITTTSLNRSVKGTATTLGAGAFTGGTDVAAGLYDVTTSQGVGGNFIVEGTDSYNEILGAGGVPEVRAKISPGDQIHIALLSHVTFTPVRTPYVTTHSAVTLYAGTWTVGQDLGPGRYVATPGLGQSGNFIIDDEHVDEFLGSDANLGNVPNVTFNVKAGDIIDISGLGQVTLAPA